MCTVRTVKWLVLVSLFACSTDDGLGTDGCAAAIRHLDALHGERGREGDLRAAVESCRKTRWPHAVRECVQTSRTVDAAKYCLVELDAEQRFALLEAMDSAK